MPTRIEDWRLHTEPNPYIAPDMRTKYLSGKVYNHPSLPDGEKISPTLITGRIGNLIATISGIRYELGTPNCDYERKHPNAKDEILGNLHMMR